ncbi:prophage tail fiber N-terminal domain-containing protein [Aeromonas enteropelogenes]|uniref:prophage tail fiber N-terminal domain-containing protein n=1 Tax=Aeromonas enteropelogenes TaxID=29489 RepID=UPI0005A86CD5|nr:prophage tail fiber N-terminal domain-containing protein [Aeromonas enteropelogenes]UBH57070.1 prophage tail fiber N-terminal domain-containing protein [Aeromonas enteropelogenes]
MIQMNGVIADPTGKPVPGALIELRALNTTNEVLMGSVLTFKCDPTGEYRFQLAIGTYDVYSQNDLCGDMDYLGIGSVTAQSHEGPLNSILVDNGINLTPPLLEKAIEAMNRAESAANSAASDKQQTGKDVIATGLASRTATEQATAAASSALNAGNAEKGVTEKATTIDQHAKEVADHATRIAAQSAEVTKSATDVAQQSTSVASALSSVKEMHDVVVAKTAQSRAAADTASEKASQTAQDQAHAGNSAQRASSAEGMAEAWAQTPENSDVKGRPGEFSALHWALQAQKWAKAITSQLVWLGGWNAAAGAPPAPLANQGIPFYRISHDGVIGAVSYLAGDYLHWDPATASWFKIDGTDAVVSVNGMNGAVVLGAVDVGARPASWAPGWEEITNKPVTMPPSEHSHPWSQLSEVPSYASRWPAWGEVTDKPDLAAANHTHAYMADGGHYGTVTLSNWIRTTGQTGWFNASYGGGIHMTDTAWVRTYNGKKFYVANTEENAIATAGGIYVEGNGSFADVYIRSDLRLKQNLEPITGALDKVKLITGQLYDKAGKREAGLIAQDVMVVQPESVYLNEDGYLSLAYAGVIALILEAIKELDRKVEALHGRPQ